MLDLEMLYMDFGKNPYYFGFGFGLIPKRFFNGKNCSCFGFMLNVL